jgi:hypothetical protein
MALEAVFNEQTKEAMLQSLKEYKEDSSSAKEFYPCTQVLTEWLQKQGEQK